MALVAGNINLPQEKRPLNRIRDHARIVGKGPTLFIFERQFMQHAHFVDFFMKSSPTFIGTIRR